MTKRERELIAKAVRHLHEDNGFDAAIEILLPLAGLRMPSREAAKKAVLVSLEEIAGRGNSEFKCPDR